MPLSAQQARVHKLVNDCAHLGIGQGQRTPATMGARPRRLGGMHGGDEGVDANIGLQGFTPVQATEGGEEALLGKAAIGGVDRSVDH